MESARDRGPEISAGGGVCKSLYGCMHIYVRLCRCV